MRLANPRVVFAASVPTKSMYNLFYKPQRIGGYLFASEHQSPAVDTFEHSGSTAVFSCPVQSRRYALHWIGKNLAAGGTNLTAGVIVSPWYYAEHCDIVV